ncbi:MAG: LEA14-like dessication related protein [Pseudohongiellaceae bacterium]|jgi:LEA14-like dessication related protein
MTDSLFTHFKISQVQLMPNNKRVAPLMKKIIILFCITLLSACATLHPNFANPTVKLINFKPLKNNGLEQRFDIDLRVTNPNAQTLKLVGMSYAIELDGFKVITGASNDIPDLPAYGDAKVNLKASIGLLQSARLFSSLLNKTRSEINYSITTKLDTGIPIIGILPVTDSGVLNMSELIKRN